MLYVGFLVSCDWKKCRSNEPPKELRELIERGKEVDALIEQFDEEMLRLYPGEGKQPELKDNSMRGIHFWLTLKEGSQQKETFQVLMRKMKEASFSELQVLCMELLESDGKEPPTVNLKAIGKFRLQSDGTVTLIPGPIFETNQESPKEWLKKANNASKQRARDRLNPFKAD